MTELWLTRIIPDLRSRQARRDLPSAVGMHHRVMQLFPDTEAEQARAVLGVLFRIEDGPQGPHILIQSQAQPDTTALPVGYGTIATKPLTPLLEGLRAGRPVRYRIAASAVRKPGKTTRALYNLKPVVPLSGTAADDWWIRQAHQSGLTIHTIHSTPLDAARGEHAQGKHRIHHARTRFDGTATITDPALLQSRLTEGIGRGKAYGCGLLTLAPA
ncbi:type I-E CRISPR-associated protein Cas6/Cse3/CasE [Streptomyces javensis]|uniref:Type I-E CRISPR-associated protein Cas6/Cse3/CasE n=1 Tax=Streptomyces javensis TaxID=114698 RepID=A0ABS0R3Q3_9ACTN|nr:type I-E CRISPR-associated protein Cas6/Cse3/CasE [Streptomyces javensis]MBI0312004.1 type I-E CRISPR-associated protein Cas6/Cse3/CasE [Streptomyces javensis]